MDKEVLARRGAHEVPLGQPGALVRAFRLGAEEHDAPVEAFLAQHLRGGRTGQARAHYHEGLASSHE